MQQFNKPYDDISTHSEINSNEEVVELRTFIPLRQQVQSFMAAGVNLEAWRRAVADFANGVQDDELDTYDDPTRDVQDLLDVHTLKTKYIRHIKAKQTAQELAQKAFDDFKKDEPAKDAQKESKQKSSSSTEQTS